MKVKVRFFAYFREIFRAKEIDLELSGPVLARHVFFQIADTPERRNELFSSGRLKPHVVVLRNGAPLPAATGLDTPLDEADTLAIFPIIGGG